MKVAILGAGILTTVSWSTIRNAQLPLGPYRKNWGPLVFGHRGCRFIEGITENTVAAFSYAKEHGAAGIECDVRTTKDGQAVIFHDEYIGEHIVFNEVSEEGPMTTLFTKKVVTPKTRIRDLNLMEVKCLLLKPYRAPKDSGREVDICDAKYLGTSASKPIMEDSNDSVPDSESINEERNTTGDNTSDIDIDVFQIPTLEEAVLFCRDNKMKLVIEMKERGDITQTVHRISELYDRYPDYMQKETIVASFFPNSLYNLRVYNKRIPVMMLHLDTVRSSPDFP
eukprot:Tbor_TRINITY_DN5915_c0_g1::TRINITY_DN5915_c0_g1_i1::g.18882::m.18882